MVAIFLSVDFLPISASKGDPSHARQIVTVTDREGRRANEMMKRRGRLAPVKGCIL